MNTEVKSIILSLLILVGCEPVKQKEHIQTGDIVHVASKHFVVAGGSLSGLMRVNHLDYPKNKEDFWGGGSESLYIKEEHMCRCYCNGNP